MWVCRCHQRSYWPSREKNNCTSRMSAQPAKIEPACQNQQNLKAPATHPPTHPTPNTTHCTCSACVSPIFMPLRLIALSASAGELNSTSAIWSLAAPASFTSLTTPVVVGVVVVVVVRLGVRECACVCVCAKRYADCLNAQMTDPPVTVTKECRYR